MAFKIQYIICNIPIVKYIYSFSECLRSEANSEPCQVSKMDHFAKIFYEYGPLTIFVKSSSSDIPMSFEYRSADSKPSLTSSKSQAANLFAN